MGNTGWVRTFLAGAIIVCTLGLWHARGDLIATGQFMALWMIAGALLLRWSEETT